MQKNMEYCKAALFPRKFFCVS